MDELSELWVLSEIAVSALQGQAPRYVQLYVCIERKRKTYVGRETGSICNLKCMCVFEKCFPFFFFFVSFDPRA